MNVEFIQQPISGQYPEKHFGRTTPYCQWVKFTTNNGHEWVGSFEQGWAEEGTFIILLHKAEKAFVVSGGQMFLVDVNSQELIKKTEETYTKSAVLDEEKEIVYFTDGAYINYIDSTGNNNTLFDHYYWDDIKLTTVCNNKLYATYYNYQSSNTAFHLEIDIITKEIKDSYYDADRNTFSCENPGPSLLKKLKNWLTR